MPAGLDGAKDRIDMPDRRALVAGLAQAILERPRRRAAMALRPRYIEGQRAYEASVQPARLATFVVDNDSLGSPSLVSG